jgi:hypothetical protein
MLQSSIREELDSRTLSFTNSMAGLMLQKKVEILQAGTVFMDVFLLNPCISCYLSKCMPSEFHDLIFDIQEQLQKIMCCERKAFRGPILIQGLPVTKIGLEDVNEVDVMPSYERALLSSGDALSTLAIVVKSMVGRDSPKPMRFKLTSKDPRETAQQ